VIERDGLKGLSMAALGRQLECGTMSIYGYFANKDELLAALTEQVLRDFVRQLPPPGDGVWREEVVTYFKAYRSLMETYVAYRELALYAPIFVLGAAFTPAQLRRLDAGVGLFTRVGLAIEDAVQVYNVCLNYTRSFVAFEHGLIGAAETAPSSPFPPRHEYAAAEYPLLSKLHDIAPLFQPNDNGFSLGLDLLVDGIVRRYRIARRYSGRPA
jgi:AcrR family transcriptional regulator